MSFGTGRRRCTFQMTTLSATLRLACQARSDQSQSSSSLDTRTDCLRDADEAFSRQRIMSTSLAAQLQARKTVDSARLQSAKTLKNPPSFIYTPRHASSVTTADLHALAANSWDQLAAIDPFFGAHYKEVLGEQAKTLDRTGLTKEENDKVGKTVDRVLRALGRHMLLKPAGVVLEWLIRRFR